MLRSITEVDLDYGRLVSDALGWSAIDGALRRVYGDTEPFHLGTRHSWALGGPDPLDGISIFSRLDPTPHWHYVSYGMSELYEKESSNTRISGWGCEFTFRLVRRPEDTEPPVWPAGFLQNLARYVFETEKWFEPGHTIDAKGPIAADRPHCTIRALTFAIDPELGVIETPHGGLQFLQVVGLTPEEYGVAQGGKAKALLDYLAPYLPLYVTDIGRRSLITSAR